MPAIESTTSPASRPDEITPGRPLMAAGHDFSWAYVVYRPVRDYAAYCVGSDGSVWTRWVDRVGSEYGAWRRMNPRVAKGYHAVSLRRIGGPNRPHAMVHALVLEAFVGPRPDGMEGCHDPDPTRSNNRVTNLRWGTRLENQADAIRHRERMGLPDFRARPGETNPTAKLAESDVLAIRRHALAGEGDREIAERFDIGIAQVRLILKGRQWAHLDPEGLAEVMAHRFSTGKALTADDVREIRRLKAEGVKQRALARQFGVGEPTIHKIVNGQTWRDILEPSPA